MKGQLFSTPFGQTSVETTVIPNSPLGRWKDGLCDCCDLGPCHPSLLNAILFSPILMAQVLTRMKMNWLGESGPESEWRQTFKRVLCIFVSYIVADLVLRPFSVQHYAKVGGTRHPVGPPPAPVLAALNNLISTAFGLYVLIVLMRLRSFIRERNQIPEKRCIGCEDLCCAAFCGCCTVAQLARQTADYKERRALCCSDTGLPQEQPAIIV